MCLYDLQKAFDSVEYPVLLQKLYDCCVNGKMWRLLKNWYEGGSCRTFFHYGSIGVFQGDISPLSSRSVLECCEMPILMFGSDTWILTEGLIDRLEAFQGELVKRVLKWLKHHSNTAAITALDVPTMRSRLLVTKLGFLRRVMERDSGSLSGRVL